jgi:exosortase C (VPDSG-CTERM-specific)
MAVQTGTRLSGSRPAPPSRPWRELSPSDRRRIRLASGYVAAVTLLFAQPLTRLVAYALNDQLHSHIPLVPLIAGYLLYIQPQRSIAAYRGSPAFTLMFSGVGVAALAASVAFRGTLTVNDHLALTTFSYVNFIVAGGFLFLGARWMALAAFPVAFLIFMVPLPDAATDWLERASVLASAEAAAWFFKMTGTPLVRDGTVFAIPGIVLKVAHECSGLHSSWVLFITSLLASHIFLDSPWRRIVLVAFVVPLGILRNGFRILVIGLLCVHIGPEMIDSVIHHRGGPIFFVLSLGPLFLLLWWLERSEGRATFRSQRTS